MTDKKVLQVTPSVHWIGVLDPDLLTFDIVMETRYGSTYNSYFIDAQKKTIVETTKEKFRKRYLDKIRQLTAPEEIEYIVVNHTEPDHSGNVKHLLDLAPKAKVVGTGNAIRYLKDQIGCEFPHIVVKDGDTLDLGDKTLKFIGAPNLHWPDSMYTWLEEDKVLFTCDSFGAHYCNEAMFDDLAGNWDDAFKYYFDVILKPYSKFMLKAIAKIRPLKIAAICPGHGPILRKYWKRYVDLTEFYANQEMSFPEKGKVLIAYVSAYQNTGLLADKIAEGIRMAGPLKVEVCDIEKMPLEELDLKLAASNALVIGTPTINQNILLQVYQLFAVVNPIRDRGKLAGAFGSYGWSGEALNILENNIKNLKLDYFGESVFVKFTPHEENLARCLAYGQAFGTKVLEQIKE